MNDYLLIASGAGLQDGLNPCVFMTSAVFIIWSRWLNLSLLPVVLLQIVFVLSYASSVSFFNFGSAQVFVLQNNFIFAAKVFYFILGLCAFILGVLYFKDWIILRKGGVVEEIKGGEIKFFSLQCLAVCLMTIIVPMFLSGLATIWPLDRYIYLLVSTALIRDQIKTLLMLLGSYLVVSMWPIWMVWAFLAIKNLRPSLVKIICSAVFFTASSCMIFIFKRPLF